MSLLTLTTPLQMACASDWMTAIFSASAAYFIIMLDDVRSVRRAATYRLSRPATVGHPSTAAACGGQSELCGQAAGLPTPCLCGDQSFFVSSVQFSEFSGVANNCRCVRRAGPERPAEEVRCRRQERTRRPMLRRRLLLQSGAEPFAQVRASNAHRCSCSEDRKAAAAGTADGGVVPGGRAGRSAGGAGAGRNVHERHRGGRSQRIGRSVRPGAAALG